MSSIYDEKNALSAGAALRDISDIGILELKGKDVLDYLHRISTNSLKELKKNEIAETLFTSEKGRVLDKTYIANFEQFQLIFTSKDYKQKIHSWIRKYIITDDVSVADVSGQYAVLELLGAEAESFLILFCDRQISDLKLNHFRTFNFEGVPFTVFKVPHCKDKFKFIIFFSIDQKERLLKYLEENKGIFDFKIVSDEAYQQFRTRSLIPVVPNEISDKYNPYELKLEHLIDTKKGCYIGQEVIARLDTYNKVQRRLLSIKIREKVEIETPYAINIDGEEAGVITSSYYDEERKITYAICIIRNAYIQNDHFEININNKNYTAIIRK